MQQFMMRGKAINGVMRYREYFCPKELLRQKEIAAGFFYQNLRQLSDEEMYHSEMFYLVALMGSAETDLIAFSEATKYYPLDIIIANLGKESEFRKRVLQKHFQQERQQKLLKQLWQVSQDAHGLSEGDRNRVYCLLVAGYALANKEFEDCPISASEAQKAFLRQTDSGQTEEWVVIPDSGNILLEARKAPYRVLLGGGKLPAGGRITQRKIVAMPHAQRSRGIPVTLQLYSHKNDPNPRNVTIEVGDYCYANFVGTVPVWFHPAVVESKTCRIERKKNKIVFLDKISGSKDILEHPSVEPVGFAAEHNASGWMLMYNGQLSIDWYSRKENDFIHKQNIVQVEFRGDVCLLLDWNGTVYTNSAEVYPVGVTYLSEFREMKL